MAYVLAIRSHSPLKRSFSDSPYLAPTSPLKDVAFGALRNISPRNASACSLYSLDSNRAGEWFRGAENTPPLATCSLLDLVPETERQNIQHKLNEYEPRQRGCRIDRPDPSISITATSNKPRSRRARVTTHESECLSNDPSSPEPMVVDSNTDDDSAFFDLYGAIQIPSPASRCLDKTADQIHAVSDRFEDDVVNSKPFRRWMSALRRRHVHRHRTSLTDIQPLAVEMVEDALHVPRVTPIPETRRRFSDSVSSSLGCVTRIRSTSITVASASIAPRSESPGFIDKARLGKRSSHFSETRKSTESHGGVLNTIVDEGAWLRSAQRRKVVEELIATEESYIADLKVLVNVGQYLISY